VLAIERANRARVATVCALLAIVALVAFSESLALNRIFQVDELQNVLTARILAKHLQDQFSAFASLMFFGPMMWLGGSIEHSSLLLHSERLLFFVVFWVNLCLIVRCGGLRLRSRLGVLGLLLTATLAPLWDYGFEIRHDNTLLTCVLLAWMAARPLGDSDKRRLFIVGFVSVIAEFVAYKAFAYVVPIAIFAIAAAWLEDRRPLLRALAAATAGAVAGLGTCLALHWIAGTWSLFTTNLVAVGKSATELRFSAVPALMRVVDHTPVLVVAVAIALLHIARHDRVNTLFARESLIPELFLFAMAVGAMIANPTPFPYNAVLVTPQAAILALRLLPRVSEVWDRDRAWRIGLAGALLLHCTFWLLSTKRHLPMTNARQMFLMTTAEQMTDPRIHRVLDGAGLVPTRYPPGYHWLIHTFSIGFFRSGEWETIRSQLARGATPVIIPNYRVAALPPADRRFIAQHYAALAGDFLVAGAVLPEGDRQWECLVTGRYYARGTMWIDGVAVREGPIVLSRGAHDVRTAGTCGVLWLGPERQTPPAMGKGLAENVFVNWY